MKYALCEIKRKPALHCLIVLYAAMILFLLFLTNARMTGFYMLYVVSRYIFYLDAALMLLLFLMASSSYSCGIDETISACRSSGFYQALSLKVFLSAFFVFQLSIAGFLAFTSVHQDGTDYFFQYAGKSFLANIFLPMFICIFVAYFLSRWKKRSAAAILLVAFLLLISPMFTSLEWETEPTWPIDKLMSCILHPFRILYENGTWAPNSQLGLQTDPGRICLLIFWVLFVSVCLTLLFLNKKIFRRSIVGILSLLAILSITMSYLPSGAYRINGNWDGVMTDYYIYETRQQTIAETESCGYRVTSYNMDLSFQRFLYSDCKMSIEADSPLEQFCFTLYHGYKITGIESETIAVTWEQQGDFVYVYTRQPLSELSLSISYYGSHSVFYSYSEGTMLPGWFPWYPMAGERQIILNYETVPSGYNTYNRIDLANITLHVDGQFELVTNLTEHDNKTYSGTSDSITLIGGEVCLTGDSVVKNYLPLELTESPNDFENSMLEQWTYVYQTMQSYGIEPTVAPDCSIIVASRDLCRYYYNNDVALFQDYILTWSGGLSVQNVSQQLILAMNPSSGLANVICSLGGLYDTPQETFQQWVTMLPSFENDSASQLLQMLSAAEKSGKGKEAVVQLAQALCNEPLQESDAYLLERICDSCSISMN